MAKKVLSFILAAIMLAAMAAIPANAVENAPEISVNGYVVSISNISGANYIRVAPGVHESLATMRKSEGLVGVNAGYIASHTVDGVFTYTNCDVGTYTFWVRYDDNSTYLLVCEVEEQDPELVIDQLDLTVKNLFNVMDISIAQGTYSTYRECVSHRLTRISDNKIAGKRDYTFRVYAPGEYTVAIRYNDGRDHVILHGTSYVETPTFTVDGLTVTVGNITGLYVIRVAPGEWSTSGEVKRAPGARNFSYKTVKNRDAYTIFFPEEGGKYTIAVQYQNGYIELQTLDISKKVPTYEAGENSIAFSGLEGLQVLRYAKGEYATMSEIKDADGAKFVRGTAISDGALTLENLEGTYTFGVQYLERSTTVFTVAFKVNEPEPEPEPEPIELASSYTVSRAIGDNMVVQRDKPFSVWGWAPESENGKYVACAFKGQIVLGKVVDGQWLAIFEKTFPADSNPAVLQTIGNGCEHNFSGVLVGDVYYVIGQSNVYWPYSGVVQDCIANGAANTVADFNTSDLNKIRLMRNSSTFYQNLTGEFQQGTRIEFPDVVSQDAVWQTPSVGANDFSAIGYMFAFRLAQNVDVPIGMIEIDASGYPLSTFAPNELVDKWKSDYPNPANPLANLVRIGNDAAGYVNTNLASRFAYNQQLYPFLRFNCAGLLWYQGESDFTSTQMLYGPDQPVFINEFTELMAYYRSHIGDGSEFPIYIVEYPSHYSNGGANPYIDFGYARTELGTAHMRIPNSYMVASSDLWRNITFWNNPHPYCKPAQALRAAQICLSTNYGKTVLNDVAGPQLREVTNVDANTVKLTFDYVGLGLTTRNGADFRGFQVMTSYSFPAVDNWETPASVSISASNELTIAHDKPIYGVRYNYGTEFYFPIEVNVCASTGIPMVAFARYWQ